MDEPGFKSKVISQDVGKQILRFENTNCFDKAPQLIKTIEELKALEERKAQAKKLYRRRKKDDGPEQKELEEVSKVGKLSIGMVKFFRQKLQDEILGLVQNKIGNFQKIPSARQDSMNQIESLNSPNKIRWQLNDSIPGFSNHKPIKMKPRDKFLAEKPQKDEAYRLSLAGEYLRKYTEISHEAADYYRQEAINLYITEQFCQGNRYSMKKHEKLRNTTM